MAASDPFKVLGIPHSADEAEIRAAYRRMVKLHHPDHNGGSPESARRFEQIQEAYALVWKLRDNGRPATTASPKPPPSDPGLEARLADLQRDVERQAKAKAEAMREAQRAHEEAMRQARDAARSAARADGERPSDEELGYVTTDDSISAILDDVTSEWSKRLSERDDEALSERLADILDEVSARLREHPPDDD